MSAVLWLCPCEGAVRQPGLPGTLMAVFPTGMIPKRLRISVTFQIGSERCFPPRRRSNIKICLHSQEQILCPWWTCLPLFVLDEPVLDRELFALYCSETSEQ